jgi:hypothetical protein
MAVMTLETLVLRGGSVVRDVVTGRAGSGCRAAKRQAPTLPYPMRQPSHHYPSAEQEPNRWLNRVNDADDAADRAGRPGSGVGMPSRHSLAQPAGLAGRGPRFRAGWCPDRFTVGHCTALGLAESASMFRNLSGGRRLWLQSTGGTLPAPTRGTAGG